MSLQVHPHLVKFLMAGVDVLLQRLLAEREDHLAEREDHQPGTTFQSRKAIDADGVNPASLLTRPQQQQQQQTPQQQQQQQHTPQQQPKQEAPRKTKRSRDTGISSATCQVAVHLLLDLLPDCVLRLGVSPARQHAQQASCW